MPKLLAITPYPYKSADTRYRIAQFKPFLERAGWQMDLHPFMDEHFFKMYSQPERNIEKIIRTLDGVYKRIEDLFSVTHYETILIHKEAFAFGPPIFEFLLKKRNPRIIYDMDDAFWTHPPQFNQIGHSLRDPNRIGKIIALSSHVLAGNNYLAQYAQRFNSAVTVFPTVLDMQRYKLREEIADSFITIGWVGRWSSAAYLEALFPVFERLSQHFPMVKFLFIGSEQSATAYHFPLEVLPWSLEQEIESLFGFDIGIMPLPDDEYSRGKCGFKLLQYMALGIPAVASPIGVNSQIVQDGENGYLASGPEEWLEKLSWLIRDIGLRKRIGLNARKTVEQRFNLDTAASTLVEVLNSLL